MHGLSTTRLLAGFAEMGPLSQAGLFCLIGLAAETARKNGLDMLLLHSSIEAAGFERATCYWTFAHFNFLVLIP